MTMIIEIEHFQDDDGRKLVRVPLTKSDKKVTLYEDDYNDLIALGAAPKWTIHNSQICVRNNKRYVQIARLIRHAGAGTRVIALDDDQTNLRKNNLLLAPGPSKFDTRNYVVKPYKDKAIVEHVNVS